MTKRTFIKRSIGFITIVFAILYSIQSILDYKMGKVKSGYVGKINKVLHKKLNEDITIWGASTAEGNFVPKIISEATGLSCFNMGLDGTNINQYEGLLKNYLNQVSNKKVILAFDIHGGLMARNSAYQIYNWLHTFNNEQISSSYSNINKSQYLKIKHIPFYKLLLYGKHNIKYLKQNKDSFCFKNKGFIPRSGVITPDTKENEIAFSNDSSVVKQIKGICILANKNNNQIYLVLTPCFHLGLKGGTNTNLILNNFKSLQNKNVHFLNFSDHPLNLEKKYFKDNTHLNAKGAKCFSQLFSQVIKKEFNTDK